jgi:hypothetical protein
MASDKNHRPCLPLKPQEKNFEAIIYKLQNEICFLGLLVGKYVPCFALDKIVLEAMFKIGQAVKLILFFNFSFFFYKVQIF